MPRRALHRQPWNLGVEEDAIGELRRLQSYKRADITRLAEWFVARSRWSDELAYALVYCIHEEDNIWKKLGLWYVLDAVIKSRDGAAFLPPLEPNLVYLVAHQIPCRVDAVLWPQCELLVSTWEAPPPS
eukprot:TRINITY_DN20223_c0_g1_i1.p2 TRINITY_DN20223_c0_g1~~TRINITY_DN20223_c0_g1_i1.p2  ORF type:complete len:151 (+),score=40.59 TRINITY_DN20223_c0_g1_i1:67-453(+)